MNPHDIILHPFVTEKTMALGNENKLEFVVKRNCNKKQIKEAIEKLLEARVEKVNTMILKDGKHAIVKFTKEYSAEDIGMRIGVF